MFSHTFLPRLLNKGYCLKRLIVVARMALRYSNGTIGFASMHTESVLGTGRMSTVQTERYP